MDLLVRATPERVCKCCLSPAQPLRTSFWASLSSHALTALHVARQCLVLGMILDDGALS